MPYTIMSRLKQVTRSPSAIRSLFQSLPFAVSQAYRAASGLQLDDVLSELEKISNKFLNHSGDLEERLISRKEFQELSEKYASGKTGGHHAIYSTLDLKREQHGTIVEIGIGTNDPKLASSMGSRGKPGASLYMWTDVFENAQIVGADVDRNILFRDKNISSYYVDQTSTESLLELVNSLERTKDIFLIIDDGLHTPEANLRTFNNLVGLLQLGGYYVIEDIENSWSGFWNTLGAALPDFECRFEQIPEKGHSADGFFVARRIR